MILFFYSLSAFDSSSFPSPIPLHHSYPSPTYSLSFFPITLFIYLLLLQFHILTLFYPLSVLASCSFPSLIQLHLSCPFTAFSLSYSPITLSTYLLLLQSHILSLFYSLYVLFSSFLPSPIPLYFSYTFTTCSLSYFPFTLLHKPSSSFSSIVCARPSAPPSSLTLFYLSSIILPSPLIHRPPPFSTLLWAHPPPPKTFPDLLLLSGRPLTQP